jgi:hypothetical protein
MLVAVPAWPLAELLDSEDVQNVKRKEEAETKKASAAVKTVYVGGWLEPTQMR